jgi:very-short-patch-repair endonuclease
MTQSRLSKLRQQPDRELLKELRANMTDAEMLLWYYLRAKRFEGWKFRRQVPLGPYVVDFLCERAGLIVEVDGGQHAERRWADAMRTRWLEEHGYRVIRFWNNEVLGNMGGVLETLSPALSPKARPSPRPSPKGEGENC